MIFYSDHPTFLRLCSEKKVHVDAERKKRSESDAGIAIEILKKNVTLINLDV